MSTGPIKKRILLVDDDETVFHILNRYVCNKYELHFLAHPERILAKVRNIRPDLIMCDIDMPGMTGGDVCRTLCESEEFKGIPFLYLTSYVSPSEVAKLNGNVGGRDGISKFTPLPAIIVKIDSYLDPR